MSPRITKKMLCGSFLALDFETTGLSHRSDRVVEIGALRFSLSIDGEANAERSALDMDGEAAPGFFAYALREEARFACLVNPQRHIPAVVTAIHGIRDSDVRDAPTFAEALPLFLAFSEGAVIVAHNAPFDISFLRSELERAGRRFGRNEVLDTRLLAKAAYPLMGSYRLQDLARRLGLAAGRAHRALDDAFTCAQLFAAIAPRSCRRSRIKARPEMAAPRPPGPEELSGGPR